MSALLIKDAISLREQLKYYIFVIGLYGVYAVVSKNSSTFAGMIAIITVMMVINTFSYDERAKWERFCMCTPISRKDLVLGKYFLGLILLLVCSVTCVIFMLFLGEEISFTESIAVILAIDGVAMIMLAIMIPAIFKLGVEKGRLVMLAFVVMILTGILGAPAIERFISNNITLFVGDINPEYIMLLVFGVCALIYGISAFVSIKIFENKEF